MATNEYKVFKKVCMKYTIMKVRGKISFIAMMEQKTICELFLHVIYKHYWQSSSDDKRKAEIDELWNAVLRGEPGFLKKVVMDANKEDEEFAAAHKERAMEDQINNADGKEKDIEHIEIKKTGKIIRKKIDHALNKDKEAKIADILKKNNCTDIFRDAFIKNE